MKELVDLIFLIPSGTHVTHKQTKFIKTTRLSVMSHELFINLSDEQQAFVAGGIDFQLDATFYKAQQNVLNGSTSSGPGGSTAASNGTSTEVETAGIAFLALGADEVLSIA
ncbi:alr5141 [Nostoc sp. PCC 7120 = FACHB-418]|nr:alr5141 [Nostoc sp. PCC 7120 = FACHB-418]